MTATGARDPIAPARRLGQGAELVPGGAHFRVWAPERRQVAIQIVGDATPHPLRREPDGHWSGTIHGVAAGARYRYRLDREDRGVPDPAARFLPDGPHGDAEVIDPARFPWTDGGWNGVPPDDRVIYELHVGTFTPAGTWQGAIEMLPALAELGVTVVEVMPVAEFAGRFGWGYDGVAWFAPTRLYGRPDDFRRFVDRAHALRMGVILDVVYNHLGPDGNYLDAFSPHYRGGHGNEWGSGINFDGAHAGPVRALVTDNAAYWVDEYHLDGLRLDAIQSLCDDSPEHIVAAIARAARTAAPARRLLITGENNAQDANFVRPPARGGAGLDGLWNDDFHHAAVVALTGRRQAYYSDYRGTAAEWLATAKHGFLFQGQRSAWEDQPRGHPTRGVPPSAFVAFLENHDQVANSLWSARLWQDSAAGCFRAMTALLCLGPWTPLLFQGQEWNASTPFHYFADHAGALGALVRDGRAKFMAQFPGCGARDGELVPDPANPDLFDASRLRWDERARPAHQRALRLHRDLLRLRRDDPTLRAAATGGVALEIAPLTARAGVVRYFVDHPAEADRAAGAPADTARPRLEERLLLVNLGPDIDLDGSAEPLLAPPASPRGSRWRRLWCSEDPRYGGNDAVEPERERGQWRIAGFAAWLLAPHAAD